MSGQVKGEANISYICSCFYWAPELIFGATEYTSIDICSAGCVLAELLLGHVCVTVLFSLLVVHKSTANDMNVLLIICHLHVVWYNLNFGSHYSLVKMRWTSLYILERCDWCQHVLYVSKVMLIVSSQVNYLKFCIAGAWHTHLGESTLYRMNPNYTWHKVWFLKWWKVE